MTKSVQHELERSAHSHAILDEASRRQKAAKIAAILGQHVDLSAASVLDIGTGSGHIAGALAEHARSVTSVDVVDERGTRAGFTFQQIDDERLPFPDRHFDVVVSNHIVEHVADQRLHLMEAMRVLKAGGHLYVATPNRFWITDPHYRVPFVNWMPRRLAAAYLRRVRHAEWDIHPLTLRHLQRLLRPYRIRNELPFLIRNPGRDDLETTGLAIRVLSKLPRRLDRLSPLYSPTLLATVQRRHYK